MQDWRVVDKKARLEKTTEPCVKLVGHEWVFALLFAPSFSGPAFSIALRRPRM